MTLALAHSLAYAGHHKAVYCHIVVFIYNDAGKLGNIYLLYRGKLARLLLIVYRTCAEKGRKRFVKHVEALHSVIIEFFPVVLIEPAHIKNFELVLFHYHFGNAPYAHIGLVGHLDFVTCPVNNLISAEHLHMLYVVRIVVKFYVRRLFIEAVYQHTLFVEVGKAHRAYYLGHTELFGPLEDFCKQRLCYFKVVYDVEPGKAELFYAEFFVGAAVPYRGDSAGNLAVFIGKEHTAVRKAESVVYRRVELGKFIKIEVGGGILVSLIQIDDKPEKFLFAAPVVQTNLFYFYHSNLHYKKHTHSDYRTPRPHT